MFVTRNKTLVGLAALLVMGWSIGVMAQDLDS